MTLVGSPVQVLLPEIVPGLEEAQLLQWLVEDGAAVRTGEPLAEIETDKAVTELVAEAQGILSQRIAAGTTVEVGTLLALIGDEHEPGGRVEEAPKTAGPVEEAPEAEPPDLRAPPARRGPIASPLARRIAGELGVSLESLTGSGPRGRIVRADVEQAAAGGSDQVAASTRSVELTRIQRTIARRMTQATSTVPHFSISCQVDMDEAVQLRGRLAEQRRDQDPRAPSYNDMVIKACALALREHPLANGRFDDDRLILNDRVNVGMAVATDGALVVPTIFDADVTSLRAIGDEARRLAGRVRDGSIAPAELEGGTFTVSNLGMFGVARFTAVINPPQSAILAVGELRRVPVVRGDALAPGHVVELTLSCDHRILYGATAAEFLRRVRTLLEQPLGLLA